MKRNKQRSYVFMESICEAAIYVKGKDMSLSNVLWNVIREHIICNIELMCVCDICMYIWNMKWREEERGREREWEEYVI